jgi:hypothetical protein
LRIDPDVREKIIDRAGTEGLPYQTLINSILRKYVEGNLIESSLYEALNDLKKEIKALKKRAS